jgi:tetratricopeptide (TPR) repeat protein
MANTTEISKRILRVVVVSPADVQDERNVIPIVIDEVNRGVADTLGLRLEILMWETDAYPGFHLDGPQGLIDSVLKIEDSDIVIGIFWKRFGTATKDSSSGTEHELKKAWASWKQNQSPQVMIYFSEQHSRPKSKAEADQWGAVLEFQENFPKEGLWWSYNSTQQFEKLVRNHLTAFLRQEYPPPKDVKESETETSFLEAPSFTDQVNRGALLSLLQSTAKSNSVMAVEGLPGSGKTYLVTSYISNEKRLGKEVFWYDPSERETLDEFLAQISLRVPLSGLSTISKCKELLSYLRKRNILLVVDDFHNVDQASFSHLINVAVKHGEPATLLLISRIYVNPLLSLPKIGRVEIRGFDLEEMRAFLRARGLVSLGQATLNSLILKTDGLPLAASLFATLVHDFNRHPNDLLRDAMLNTERLGKWFHEVCSQIGETEQRLLQALSIADGPFNMNVVRALGRHVDIPRVDQTFETLQRTYLVQKYSPYRWNIHHLIAMFCASELTDKEKEDVHRALARHYLRNFYIREPRVLSEREFTFKVKACKQFQLARDFKQSQRLIHDLSKTAKTRGYYDILMQLIETEIQSTRSRNGWLDYHYAHCCLITGKLKRGLEVIEPLLYVVDEEDANKQVAFTRLYAEIIGSIGNAELALKKLHEVLHTFDPSMVKANVYGQACSVEGWLLTLLKRYEQAEEVCLHTLNDSLQRNDKTAEAVAVTRLGIISELRGYPEDAHKNLANAVGIFRELEDRRGLAWSLAHLAYTKLTLDNEDGAIANLHEAVRIEADIGGCSIDYFKLLEAFKEKSKNRRINRIVDAEIRRVSWALNDLTNSP